MIWAIYESHKLYDLNCKLLLFVQLLFSTLVCSQISIEDRRFALDDGLLVGVSSDSELFLSTIVEDLFIISGGSTIFLDRFTSNFYRLDFGVTAMLYDTRFSLVGTLSDRVVRGFASDVGLTLRAVKQVQNVSLEGSVHVDRRGKLFFGGTLGIPVVGQLSVVTSAGYKRQFTVLRPEAIVGIEVLSDAITARLLVGSQLNQRLRGYYTLVCTYHW